MKKILTIILSTLLVVSFASASAKTTTKVAAKATATTTKKTIQTKTVINTSNVSIENSKITKQNETQYSVSFDIKNNVGIQSGIRYGLELIDISSSEIIDTQLENTSLTLKEQESKNINLAYSLPKYISNGNYKLVIIAETENGFPLSYVPTSSPETTININNNYTSPQIESCSLSVVNDASSTSYTNVQNLDILQTENIKATCKLTNNGTNNIDNLKVFLITHKKDIFGDILSNDVAQGEIALKAKSSQEISFVLPTLKTPQSYTIDTFLTDSKNAKVSKSIKINYVIHGQSATIQNVILNKDSYKKGSKVGVTVFWSQAADNFTGSRLAGTKDNYILTAEIYDSNKELCGSTTQAIKTVKNELINNVLNVNVNKDCNNIYTLVSIKNKENKVLDTQKIDTNNPTTTININPEISSASTINSINKIYVFIFLLVVVLIGYGINEIKKEQ